jgi:hypothetical protein
MSGFNDFLEETKDEHEYIVSKIEGTDVEVKSIKYPLTSTKCATIVFSDLLGRDLVGIDGKRVDLSLGALVSITHDEKDGELATRIANIIPSNDNAWEKYNQARRVLGLGDWSPEGELRLHSINKSK